MAFSTTTAEVEQPSGLLKEGGLLTRDPEFYFHDNTVIFRIQDTLFRVHEDFLSSEPNLLWSRICQSRLSKEWLDGSSDDRAIDLDGVPASEFRALLEHFYYERTRGVADERKEEYFQELLAVSTGIRMFKVFQHASEELGKLTTPQ